MKRPLSGKHVRVYVAYEQAVKVGGVIFTQATAIILLTLRGVWINNWFKRRLTAVSAAIFVFDFPWQVWQGIRADMPGCLSYIIARDTADHDAIWITEVWDSQESHQASLALPVVQEAIGQGRPLIAGFGERFITEPEGGHGLQ